MEEFKLYIVKFKENDTMKKKIYLSHYIIHSSNYYPIILITHNQYTFFTKNNIWKASI